MLDGNRVWGAVGRVVRLQYTSHAYGYYYWSATANRRVFRAQNDVYRGYRRYYPSYLWIFCQFVR